MSVASRICTIFLVIIFVVVAYSFESKVLSNETVNEKSTWPECLGEDCHICASLILVSVPDISVIQFVYPGMVVTTDFRLDRVRIYVDENCSVIQTPIRG